MFPTPRPAAALTSTSLHASNRAPNASFASCCLLVAKVPKRSQCARVSTTVGGKGSFSGRVVSRVMSWAEAIRGVARLVRVCSLVVRQPAATRGDTRNRVEQSVRVTGITKVGEAAVRGVDKIRWHIVVVEKRGDVVRRVCKKVIVQLLDGRRSRWRRRLGKGCISGCGRERGAGCS